MVATVAASPRIVAWTTALVLPLALVLLLRAAPGIDERWEDQPTHFWIVLAAGLVNAALAVAISEAGRRRRDARLPLLGLAVPGSAGVLGLPAPAPPRRLPRHGHAG